MFLSHTAIANIPIRSYEPSASCASCHFIPQLFDSCLPCCPKCILRIFLSSRILSRISSIWSIFLARLTNWLYVYLFVVILVFLRLFLAYIHIILNTFLVLAFAFITTSMLITHCSFCSLSSCYFFGPLLSGLGMIKTNIIY